MKRVYIHAYLQGNLGDDLFVRILCERYPSVLFYIYADESYNIRFRDIPNCKVISPSDTRVIVTDNILAHFNIQDGYLKLLIKCCTAVIHIGGSAFTQHFDDWSSFFKYDETLVQRSKRMYLIGANFGPFTDNSYLRMYHELFKKYKGITLRDRYSQSLFADIPHVSYAPDVLFQLKTRPLHEKQKKVVVSIIELEDRKGKYDISIYEAAYRNFHVKLIQRLIQMGYKISLVSFCKREGDTMMALKIYNQIDNEQKRYISVIEYKMDLKPIIREFEEAEAVVGTRFHSIVLGMCYRCKVLPIIYNQKTEKMLDDLQYPLFRKLSELADVDLENDIRDLLSIKPMEIDNLVEKSKEQFQYTDELLYRKSI